MIGSPDNVRYNFIYIYIYIGDEAKLQNWSNYNVGCKKMRNLCAVYFRCQVTTAYYSRPNVGFRHVDLKVSL